MHANVVKFSREQTSSQGLELPESPELAAAERAHAELKSELANARTDFATLNMGFDHFGIRRVDGELFPPDGRTAQLGNLFNLVAKLEVRERDAQRNLAEARRAFGESAAQRLKPAIDEICESTVEHIEAAEQLVGQLEAFAAEARAAGIQVPNRHLERAASFAQRLYTLRGELVPTPTIGVRR